jgi:predicted nucleic acid-binding Zn ribbon protein
VSPWKPLPDPDGVPPRRLGESLDRVARSMGAGGSATLSALFEDWEAMVGPQVAAHARPRSLRGGVLVVVADQPGWATQLRYLETDLLARLGERLGPGAVSAIEVRVG